MGSNPIGVIAPAFAGVFCFPTESHATAAGTKPLEFLKVLTSSVRDCCRHVLRRDRPEVCVLSDLMPPHRWPKRAPQGRSGHHAIAEKGSHLTKIAARRLSGEMHLGEVHLLVKCLDVMSHRESGVGENVEVVWGWLCGAPTDRMFHSGPSFAPKASLATARIFQAGTTPHPKPHFSRRAEPAIMPALQKSQSPPSSVGRAADS
jgi:hypothetical protein